MITQGIALSAKQAFLIGLHQPNDQYKIALYRTDAKIGPELQKYTPNGEISGNMYEAGGIKLSGFKTGVAGKSAWVSFDDIKLSRASFQAAGAVVYNASKDNAVMCVLAFGGERGVFDGTFELKFPKPTETNALILLA
jgi:hypothetical protein